MSQFIVFIAFLSVFFGQFSYATSQGALTAERVAIFFICLPALMFAAPKSSISALRSIGSKGLWGQGFLPMLFYFLWAVVVLISFAVRLKDFSLLNGLLISLSPIICFLYVRCNPSSEALLIKSLPLIIIFIFLCSVAAFLLGVIGHISFFAQLTDGRRVRLLMYEPNIFGETMAALLFLNFINVQKRVRFSMIAQWAALSCVLLSFSKGPIIGALAGGLIYVVLTKQYKSALFQRVAFLGSIVLFILVVTNIDKASDILENALIRKDALAARSLTLKFALERVFYSPWIGNGPLSFSSDISGDVLLQQFGSQNKTDVWIWQMFVAIMYDTGIIGILLYVGFVISTIVRGWRYSKLAPSCAAATAAFGSLMISCQFTTIHHSAFFGILSAVVLNVSGRVKFAEGLKEHTSKFPRFRLRIKFSRPEMSSHNRH